MFELLSYVFIYRHIQFNSISIHQTCYTVQGVSSTKQNESKLLTKHEYTIRYDITRTIMNNK